MKQFFIDYLEFMKSQFFWIKRRIAQHKLNKFLVNNDVCSLYMGLPGAGKSTYIAYIVHLCTLCDYPVYCNVPVDGAFPIYKDDIGKYDTSHGLILIDEAGLVYDNRKFDNQFTDYGLDFLKRLRHHHCAIALFSQSMDIDVKWIRMSKSVFLIYRSLIKGFTSVVRVRRTFDIPKDKHQFEDIYEKPTGLRHMIFHFRFWRKPYYKMFDSWEAPKLTPFPPNRKPYVFRKGI